MGVEREFFCLSLLSFFLSFSLSLSLSLSLFASSVIFAAGAVVVRV